MTPRACPVAPLPCPDSQLYIYRPPGMYLGVCRGPLCGLQNPGLTCLPMGSAARDALTSYYGPPRCQGYEDSCAAGEYPEGWTCQACPAGALPLASLSPPSPRLSAVMGAPRSLGLDLFQSLAMKYRD